MTSILTLEQRKNAFFQLGRYLAHPDEALEEKIYTAQHRNSWFTPQNIRKAIMANATMLNSGDLDQWFNSFSACEPKAPNKIGLILAGNIPLVGFHDILCILATGNTARIKLSSQDAVLIPFLLKKLIEIEPGFAEHVQLVERLENFNAVIATGSNNTSRYFEYYFGKHPHIIRKNRNSVAIISDSEDEADFYQLGHDIFDYFGLGCRNVSKIYVPKDYDFSAFFKAIQSFESVADHHKYNNNYDYNKSIYLVNGQKHLDNGFLLVKKDERLASPLAVLYYEEYENRPELEQRLVRQQDQIQCVVCKNAVSSLPTVAFGQTQSPKLWDYADGINTIEFLMSF